MFAYLNVLFSMRMNERVCNNDTYVHYKTKMFVDINIFAYHQDHDDRFINLTKYVRL